MKTDPLFYRIFQERPATVFELAGLAVPADAGYQMHAVEIKQTAFRLDGLLVPDPSRPDLPLVFAESQFYPDPWFYARWLASIFLHLYRHRIVRPWHAVVVFPDASVDTGETAPYEVLLRGGILHRVYLSDLVGRESLALGPRLARLVVMDAGPLVVEARDLIEEQSEAEQRDFVVDLIETVLVYKFPKLSRAEIQAMLHLPETDLKKTRFYQEVFREGQEDGEKRGEARGEARGEKRGEKRGMKRGQVMGQLALVTRLLGRRLGCLSAEQQAQIDQLSAEDLGALGEALLDFSGSADLDRWLQGQRGG
jgi:predicted transposase/invertase (TIGR01784 family)